MIDRLDRANRLIPGGSCTASKSPSRYVLPKVVQSAQGCRFTATDGREYLDFGMGLGACILGYNHPEVNQAVVDAIAEGVLFTLPSYREGQAAEAILAHIPWADQVRFGRNGTDVTTAAVRVARAATGRETIYHCGYHGWADWSMTKSPAFGVVPTFTRSFTRNEWMVDGRRFNDLDGLQPAAIVVEIAQQGMVNHEFYQSLRDWCDRTKTLLIFDEVLSGFRFRMGSATDVVPDLACFGKSIGNGFGVSALVGKRELMSWFEPGKVFFSGTSFGETTGLAAMVKTLEIMERDRVPEYITYQGDELVLGINETSDWFWRGESARTVLDTNWPQVKQDFFQQECMKRGLLFIGAHNMSMAHDDADILDAIEIYNEVLEYLDSIDDYAAALEGPPTFVPYRVQ